MEYVPLLLFIPGAIGLFFSKGWRNHWLWFYTALALPLAVMSKIQDFPIFQGLSWPLWLLAWAAMCWVVAFPINCLIVRCYKPKHPVSAREMVYFLLCLPFIGQMFKQLLWLSFLFLFPFMGDY